MPEMTFSVRWPDGRTEDCYSPSLVVHDYLVTGSTYTVADFTGRAATAMDVASERVRAKFGFACTSAAATRARIDRSASAFDAGDTVEVLAMHPPLPGRASS